MFLHKNIVAILWLSFFSVRLFAQNEEIKSLMEKKKFKEANQLVDQKLEKSLAKLSAEGGPLDLTPRGIIRRLDLRRPIYRKTASYGHFGRDEKEFTWEKLDAVKALKKEVK